MLGWSRRTLRRGAVLAGGESVVAPDVAQGARALARDDHAMAHVGHVVAVAGEASSEVVKLVDQFEWLTLHDDRLQPCCGRLPLGQLDSLVAKPRSRGLTGATPSGSVHCQTACRREGPIALGIAVGEALRLYLCRYC